MDSKTQVKQLRRPKAAASSQLQHRNAELQLGDKPKRHRRRGGRSDAARATDVLPRSNDKQQQ